MSVLDAMNEHLSKELYASHLYLAMAAYCEAANLPGLAHWMRVQSDEERDHALKFYDFINARNGRVTVRALEQPPAEFGSPLDVFEQALEHEREVSSLINKLYARAASEQDFASQAFLQWFVSEQVEEERIALYVVDTLRMIGDDKVALLMLDRELGRRGPQTAAAPPPTG